MHKGGTNSLFLYPLSVLVTGKQGSDWSRSYGRLTSADQRAKSRNNSPNNVLK